jgi:hypothetical protein
MKELWITKTVVLSILRVLKMYHGSIKPDRRTPKYTILLDNWEPL